MNVDLQNPVRLSQPAPLHCCPRTLACPGIHHLLKYEVSNRAGMWCYWLACFKTFYYTFYYVVVCIDSNFYNHCGPVCSPGYCMDHLTDGQAPF